MATPRSGDGNEAFAVDAMTISAGGNGQQVQFETWAEIRRHTAVSPQHAAKAKHIAEMAGGVVDRPIGTCSS
jgi:hypothetical protein